jgi:DHA3 family tetracycline resistance protein-like MFS transporter
LIIQLRDSLCRPGLTLSILLLGQPGDLLIASPIRKWNPRTLYLFNRGAQEFLYNMAFGVAMIFMVTEVRLNPLQLVLVGTVLEGTIFVFEVPTGIVADVYSRRLSIIIGVFIVGLSMLVWAVPNFAGILLAQFIWGVGYTFTSGATSAWLVDEVGEGNAGPVFLRAAQIESMAAVGGTIAAMIIGSFSLQLPMMLSGALFMVLGLLLVAVMDETGFSPTPKEDRTTFQQMGHTFIEGVRSVRGKPVLIALLAVTAILGAASEGIDRLWIAHVVTDIGFPDVILPAFLPIRELQPVHWLNGADLLMGIAIAWALRLSERFNLARSQRSLAVSLIVLTALRIGLTVWFALAGGFWAAILAMMLMSITRMLREPLTEIWLNQQIDSKVRATVLSMNGQADAIGQAAIGPLFGWVGSAYSIRSALIAAGLTLVPTLPLYSGTLGKKGLVERVPADGEI